ncbi:hypothetical protein NQ314_004079 [Rhamnusium bicolor]|uniref:Suppressor of cytokine signaling 6 n=1 Tax=Rhamnusium bicolor TaxID=1586634 RepID=A0AAV8ZM23_9CUCU|nr:hypothetical protein NQ314_004079 [Rhamnusium bicolor]
MANSNNKETKSWIYRLRHLRIRRTSADTNTNNNEDFAAMVYRRNFPPYVNDATNYSRTRNSFRKNLRKMHTRVKNVFKHRNTANSTHTIQVSSVPTSSQSRIGVSSSTRVENIYTLEPVKEVTSNPSAAEAVCDGSPRIAGENHLSYDNLVSSICAERPVIPPRNLPKRTFPQLCEVQNIRVPKIEVVSLSNCYWYWGPISRKQADDRLDGFPDGAFLIRDSSSDRYIFTMSFRSVGRTLHTRIELSKSGYSFFDQGGYHSITELVEDALSKSKNGIYCYTKSGDEINPNYPVRLTLPVSRYDEVPSLKYLSRFVIRQCININDIEKLPLPLSLINYLQEDGPYF